MEDWLGPTHLLMKISGIKSVNQPLITEAYCYSDKYKIDFGMLSDEFISILTRLIYPGLIDFKT